MVQHPASQQDHNWPDLAPAPTAMKFKLTLLLLWVYAMGYAQPVNYSYKEHIPSPPSPVQLSQLRTAAAEICNNGIDDDNNGLIDERDPACYFNGFSPNNCKPASVVWGITGNGELIWFDMITGAAQIVGKTDPGMLDITWAPNGKLYCVGGIFESAIWEVDPNTFQAKLITNLRPRYVIGNSLTADKQGNLYLTVSEGRGNQILKYNIATQETCIVADLNPLTIFPAGDLTFLDEMLYLTTVHNQLVKIDVRTGAISLQIFTNSSPPLLGYFGLVSMPNGFLYVASGHLIYQVDPANAVVNNTPAFTLPWANQDIFGLAGYSELCESPYCTAQVSIKSNDSPISCITLGVLLTGSATTTVCTPAVSSLSWTMPNGAIVASHEIKAFTPGKYYLNYTSTQETCDRIDSFTLVYTPNAPLKVQASYTLPVGCSCTGAMTVKAGCGSGHFSYAWSTGATTPTVTNICPGNYSVKVTDLDWGDDTTVHITLPAVNPIQQIDITPVNEHCKQSDGSITITNIHGGTSPYSFSLNNQPFGARPEFTSLTASVYSVTVKDNTGCTLQKPVTILAAPGPEKIWYTKKDAYCGLPAGTLTIDSVKSGASPYTFSLDNGSFNPQTSFTDLTPGARSLTVKDRYGCLLNESFTIYQSEALQIALSPRDTTICASLKVPFSAMQLGNNPGVQYSWDQLPFSPANTFNLPVFTDKKMIVQAIDKYGCTAFDSATITAPYCDSLFAKCVLFPNAFTPNKDGLNDTFGPIPGSCTIKKYRMMIYNRWGQMIFQTSDPFQKWNGATNGQAPQSDTYVYTCVWTDIVGVAHSQKGTVVLIR